ncbi:MAG: FAD-dependent oxidoreductase [Candidatus Onthovivens sp.]|nr:FAD-dependent oxidoreductase [Candidatus Onthovivens sp.]
MEVKDLIIIGAGPSGVSAAIYAKRANLDFIIFEKFAVGGQVINAFEIENYPGFNKIFGSDLAINFMNNLTALNVEAKYEEVVSLEKNEDIFILKTSLDNVYYAKNVILALGSNPRKLNLPNEDQFTGRGISYCAMCDGNFYKDKEILVYGGGNSAISEALFLTNIVKKLTIVSRSNLRADKSLVEELSSKQNVDILENKLVDSLIIDNNEIKGVKLKDKFNNEITSLNIEGIFVYIGAIPSTSFLTNLGILNKEGYIEVNNHFETKINNLYAIGDVINKDLRQIVTATNDGAFAIHYLLEKFKK